MGTVQQDTPIRRSHHKLHNIQELYTEPSSMSNNVCLIRRQVKCSSVGCSNDLWQAGETWNRLSAHLLETLPLGIVGSIAQGALFNAGNVRLHPSQHIFVPQPSGHEAARHDGRQACNPSDDA